MTMICVGCGRKRSVYAPRTCPDCGREMLPPNDIRVQSVDQLNSKLQVLYREHAHVTKEIEKIENELKHRQEVNPDG